MLEQNGPPERLLPLCHELLDRQKDALIRGDVRRLERITEGVVSIMMSLQPLLNEDRPVAPKPAVCALRERVRLNRVLLSNGLAAADRFAAGLAVSPETTSILFSECV